MSANRAWVVGGGEKGGKLLVESKPDGGATLTGMEDGRAVVIWNFDPPAVEQLWNALREMRALRGLS